MIPHFPTAPARARRARGAADMALYWAAGLLAAGMIQVSSASDESHTYTPTTMPQDANPAWQLVGGRSIRAEIEADVLRVEGLKPEWAEWRLGVGQDGSRDFGDAHALPVEKGDAITVDFRVRVLDRGLPDEVPALRLWVVNGLASVMIFFHKGELRMAGNKTSIKTDTTEWGEYRIVAEGNRGWLYCLQSGESIALDATGDRDYGRFLAFGKPELEPAAEKEAALQAFELSMIRWYPNQALLDPPSAASP